MIKTAELKKKNVLSAQRSRVRKKSYISKLERIVIKHGYNLLNIKEGILLEESFPIPENKLENKYSRTKIELLKLNKALINEKKQLIEQQKQLDENIGYLEEELHLRTKAMSYFRTEVLNLQAQKDKILHQKYELLIENTNNLIEELKKQNTSE